MNTVVYDPEKLERYLMDSGWFLKSQHELFRMYPSGPDIPYSVVWYHPGINLIGSTTLAAFEMHCNYLKLPDPQGYMLYMVNPDLYP